ncbi:MAG: hypothetical protein NT102_06230 [Caldiserica bacterium]|nr:hypothetical protein [Caldisericota bacterium]
MRRAVVIMALIAIAFSLTACRGPEPVSFEELFSPYNPVGHVRTSDVESIRMGTTYREIITRLGATRDVGSGLHVAQYVVDEKLDLYLSFADPSDTCTQGGRGLLNTMTFGELLSYDNAIAHIRASDVDSIPRGLTYWEIITRLGKTRDMGSGLHIAQYVVDEKQNLYIGFADMNEVCPKSGSELLQNAQPIVDERGTIGIRGVVTDIVRGKDGITMLVEGKLEHDTSFDKASVTVNMNSTVLRDSTPVTGLFAFSEIKKGDTVEVTFNGPVAESHPVQGVAATVHIVTAP